MKIGLSSAVFYPQKSEIAIEKLISMGFGVAEFFYNCEYEISPQFAGKIKELFRNADSELIAVHPFTAFAESVFFFSDYQRRTDENLKKYSDVFKTIKELGAKYLTFHGDRAYEGIDDSACRLNENDCSTFQKLCDIAAENGINLCLENVAWCKSANINYLRSVAEKVDKIGFTLDLKQARRAGIDIKDYLNVMGNKIRNIHISDYDDEHDCLLPGEGKFDFKAFFDELAALDYSGDVIIEVYSSNYKDEGQIVRAKAFLESLLV